MVALVRALAILAAAFVIGHGAVPEARVATSAIRAIHALRVEIKAGAIDPASARALSPDHLATDAQEAAALPEGLASLHGVELSGRVPVPASVRAPRRFVPELTPVARGPPSLV